MSEKLVILPSLKKMIHNSVTATCYYAMSIHRKAYMVCGKKSNFFALPNYEYLSVDQLFEYYVNNSFFYPKEAMERLISQLDDDYGLKRMSAQIENLDKVCHYFKNREEIERYVHNVRKHIDRMKVMGTKCYIPIMIYQNGRNSSIDYSHVFHMGNNDCWVRQLIQFFSVITEGSFSMDVEGISFDDFLFDENGRIVLFIGYELLSYNRHGSQPLLLQQNLRAFSKLITSFFSYYYLHCPNGSINIYHHQQPFFRLYNRLKDGVAFNSFEEVFRFYFGEESSSKREKIGVFLDVANIYKGIHHLKINYHALFTKLYGVSAQGKIRGQYASLFLPVYEDEKKTEFVQLQLMVLKDDLEQAGFEVLEVKNGRDKAKEIIDGQERDVDDYKLIQKMLEKFYQLDSILLLSGDDHFYDVLLKYKHAQKDVKIISVHPDDTSRRITEDFATEHCYITEYWDCIDL
ncbi:NYN domain-containing protein [Anoxybacillus sp. D401a]|uniref:NYN domain-containing protein n=1 Tax=Anoxybacillus sp. D401a TaxID=575112 RepID=UPI003D3495C2